MVTHWKIIRGPTRKAIGNGDPMRRVNDQISLYPPHENRKIEGRVREIHQEISEVRNLKRTKDGTNNNNYYYIRGLRVFSRCEDDANDRNTKGTSSIDCTKSTRCVSHTVYHAHGNSKGEGRGRSRYKNNS